VAVAPREVFSTVEHPAGQEGLQSGAIRVRDAASANELTEAGRSD
jgi:hypothetical protein